ncbi:MAG: cob(I)yrinic acid a,c-diamide adenosyltransferase [Dehalococcoidales bacterium]|nr:cob(I)yrinic acid a,c-diamide adenosyltransferase [Dehalococcoidales bacterium]
MTPEKLEKGLVSVFTGDGKGKTSTAIGIASRAAGHGLKVYFAFFLKAGNYVHGERKSLFLLSEVTFESFGCEGWVDKDNIRPQDIEQSQKGFTASRNAVLGGEYDVVIMDEVNMAVNLGLIPVDDLLKLISEKPENVELILTGRYADVKIIQAADMVTEMLSIKHPYNSGIQARRGIDY